MACFLGGMVPSESGDCGQLLSAICKKRDVGGLDGCFYLFFLRIKREGRNGVQFSRRREGSEKEE